MAKKIFSFFKKKFQFIKKHSYYINAHRPMHINGLLGFPRRTFDYNSLYIVNTSSATLGVILVFAGLNFHLLIFRILYSNYEFREPRGRPLGRRPQDGKFGSRAHP